MICHASTKVTNERKAGAKQHIYKMINEFYPIAAISTPYGRGGIAVIRMSGSGSIEAADKFFVPKSKKKVSELEPNTAVYGDILNDGEVIDTGIITVFRAPRSYTGEDTVEISCHGGITLARSVLESAYICGCRPAGAGEFTKRAFINGKLSLSQAEAVAGLIDARSKEALKLSSAQSRGILSRKIKLLSDDITMLLASVYAGIDYPDEDLAELSTAQLKAQAEDIYNELVRLSDTYRSGKAVCEGIPAVIIGRPNTGKSSLMNALLGEDRAIVTDAAGTTRDTIEETLTVGKVLLRLCDTAGLRNTNDKIEKIGIEKAREKLFDAELILAVFDGSSKALCEDMDIISELSEIKKNGSAEIIPLISKCDLAPKGESGTEERFAPELVAELGEPIYFSSVTGEGTELIIKRISELFVSGDINYSEDAIISNARQYASICEARDHVRNALSAIDMGLAQDIAGLDLETALSRLSELDGRQTASDITDKIFASFCVGK